MKLTAAPPFGFCPAPERSQALRPSTPGVALRSTKGQGLRLPLATRARTASRSVSRSAAARSLVLTRRSPERPVPPPGAQLSPLIFLAASLACALRASSRLSAAGSNGRYRSKRSLYLAARRFFCECFRCPFNHPRANLAGISYAHFSPCDLICHCAHHRYTESRPAPVHRFAVFLISFPFRLFLLPHFSAQYAVNNRLFRS